MWANSSLNHGMFKRATCTCICMKTELNDMLSVKYSVSLGQAENVCSLLKKKQQQKPMPTCRIISPRIQQHNGSYEYHQCNVHIFFCVFCEKNNL